MSSDKTEVRPTNLVGDKEHTMIASTIALAELAEKGSDIDVLCQMAKFIAQGFMDIDAEGHCSAGYDVKTAWRPNRRNGFRRHTWKTRAGSVELKIHSSCVKGSYFPEFLEPPPHGREGAPPCSRRSASRGAEGAAINDKRVYRLYKLADLPCVIAVASDV